MKNEIGPIETKLNQLIKELIEAKVDAKKCDKNQTAAGIRLRKSMFKAIDDAKEIRKMVISERNKRLEEKGE